MREILFRGQSFADRTWVFGDKSIDLQGKGRAKCTIATVENCDDGTNIIRHTFVIPETVGQYTGLTDKNGKKIFEGDRVRYDDDEIAEIEWDEQTARFILSCDGVIYDFDNFRGDELEVIGNIYETPNC